MRPRAAKAANLRRLPADGGASARDFPRDVGEGEEGERRSRRGRGCSPRLPRGPVGLNIFEGMEEGKSTPKSGYKNVLEPQKQIYEIP